jgi:transposase-like protein
MAEKGRMTAAQVVDKVMSSEHADVVRESVAWLVAELMDAEVAAQIGAEFGEVSSERVTHRNGYRARPWQTRAGRDRAGDPEAAPGQLLPELSGAAQAL